MTVCSALLMVHVLTKRFNLIFISPQDISLIALGSVQLLVGKLQVQGEEQVPLWCPAMDTMLNAVMHHDLRLVEMSPSFSDDLKPLIVSLGFFFLPHLAFCAVPLESSYLGPCLFGEQPQL